MKIRTLHVGGIADHLGVRETPALVKVRQAPVGHEILSIEPCRTGPGPDAEDLASCLLLPGLVNAHTHLDLTRIGPIPHDPRDGFLSWVGTVREQRPASESLVREAVRRGVELSRAGGSVAVGDIDGALGSPRQAPWAAQERLGSGLQGVSFLEFFAFKAFEGGLPDDAVSPAFGQAGADEGVSVSPHAPYSVSLDAMSRAARFAGVRHLPVCTHLAETPEEHEFIAEGTGPFRAFLERLGLWSDEAAPRVGKGLHPIAYLEPALAAGPGRWLVAHVNDCDEAGLRILARHRVSVAYCPRASSYFGAPNAFGPHAYREMLDAGINVCLGTDSILNLDTPERISVLDEARLLWSRDGTDPLTLVAMMTVNGAHALGLDPNGYEIREGATVAGLVGVPIGQADAGKGSNKGPLVRVLESREPPVPIAITRGRTGDAEA